MNKFLISANRVSVSAQKDMPDAEIEKIIEIIETIDLADIVRNRLESAAVKVSELTIEADEN